MQTLTLLAIISAVPTRMPSDFEMKGLETTETAIVPVMDDNCDTSRHHMHRKLGARQLQLITLAGGIGCE